MYLVAQPDDLSALIFGFVDHAIFPNPDICSSEKTAPMCKVDFNIWVLLSLSIDYCDTGNKATLPHKSPNFTKDRKPSRAHTTCTHRQHWPPSEHLRLANKHSDAVSKAHWGQKHCKMSIILIPALVVQLLGIQYWPLFVNVLFQYRMSILTFVCKMYFFVFVDFVCQCSTPALIECL